MPIPEKNPAYNTLMFCNKELNVRKSKYVKINGAQQSCKTFECLRKFCAEFGRRNKRKRI